MRLPHVRLRVWLLLVFVALTAVGTSAWVLRERAWQYRRKADLYSKLEQRYRLLGHTEDLDLEKSAAFMNRVIVAMKHSVVESKHLIERRREHGEIDCSLADSLEAETRQNEQGVHNIERFRDDMRNERPELEAIARYYASLAEAYRRAATRPWAALPAHRPPPTAEIRVPVRLPRHDYRHAIVKLYEGLEHNVDVRSYLSQHPPAPPVLTPHPIHGRHGNDRDGKRALDAAAHACETNQEESETLERLAVACAEVGNFQAAIYWQTEALSRLAPNSQRRQASADRLAKYQQGKRYGQEPGTE